MSFFCFNVLLIAFCLVCEVVSDDSEFMLPSKDHRTMRLNMRVGKRFGDVYDEDDEINKRDLPNPKRRLRLVFRPGKRNYGDPEQTQFYTHQGENFEDRSIKAPKRKLRMHLRTGKRTVSSNDPDYTFTPQSQIDTSEPHYDYEVTDIFTDPKRSSHFLMNPRVGKNDRNWKVHPLINLQKRNDPKATDLWFGPRLGRSNDEGFDPWNYIVFNGNNVPKVPVFKSQLDDQPIEEATN